MQVFFFLTHTPKAGIQLCVLSAIASYAVTFIQSSILEIHNLVHKTINELKLEVGSRKCINLKDSENKTRQMQWVYTKHDRMCYETSIISMRSPSIGEYKN